jgi:hypothetical protein
VATKSKKKQLSRKKRSAKIIQKGTIGNFFIFGILALLLLLGFAAVGGLPSQISPQSGQVVGIITPTPGQNYSNLQLKWFGYVTQAPTPTPSRDSICNSKAVNTEPEILAGFYPGPGQTVSSTGQIKVWVNDEGPPFVAPGENINNTTGQVITHGDTSAKAPDGYLFEPALYVGTPVEQGGTPHFPDYIKGDYNNTTGSLINQGSHGAPVDPVPQGTTLHELFTAEDIWNVTNLGLSPGTYQAEFVIHDGDIDLGVGCVSITIQ